MTNEERYSSSGGGGSTASHMKNIIFKTEIAGKFFSFFGSNIFFVKSSKNIYILMQIFVRYYFSIKLKIQL